MAEYVKYYGLSENPFSDSPDPRFFYPSETHNETRSALQYGIDQRKGFILILGEEGIGKTAVIQHLIATRDDNVRAVYIRQGHTSFEPMLKDILTQLGLGLQRQTKGMMLHDLYHFLIQCLERNENVVVVIDDAHKLSLETVEELRLMSNLETSKSKLLQIVLVGRPELNVKLSEEIIRQIKQRIVVRNSIRPLTASESGQYIDHRLKMAGGNGQTVFTPKALSLICKYGGGIPRTMNTLCHNALLAGYCRAEKKVSSKTVRKVHHIKGFLTAETAQLFKPPKKMALSAKYYLIFLVLLVITGAIFLYKPHIVSVLEWFQSKVSEENRPKAPLKDEQPVKTAAPIPNSGSNIPQAANPMVGSTTRTACDIKPDIPIRKIVTVKRGGSLSLLALRYYNEANMMLIDYILEMNPEISDLDLIQVSQKVRLPDVSGVQFLIHSSNKTCKVHLETFASTSEALQYKNQPALKGKDIEIVPRKVSPRETWYRVLAGNFTSKEEAERLMNDLKTSGIKPSLHRLVFLDR